MHVTEFRVRDYECDMQGIVNNAVYQNYFEHARHQMLEQAGVSFQNLTEQGVYPVIHKAEVSYEKPLKPDAVFNVHTTFEVMSKVKYKFIQAIMIDTYVHTKAEFIVVVKSHEGRIIQLDDALIKNLTNL